MPTTHPTVSDVTARITRGGFASPDSGLITQALAQIIALAQSITGFKPFLAEAVDSTRIYQHPTQGILKLPGYVSITSLTTGITYDSTGTASAGTVRVLNYDYKYTQDDNEPIRLIEFRRAAGYGEIKIIGKRGFTANLSDDFWQAELEGAAVNWWLMAQQGITGGLKSLAIGSGDLQVAFADPANSVAAGWMKSFTDTMDNPQYHNWGF